MTPSFRELLLLAGHDIQDVQMKKKFCALSSFCFAAILASSLVAQSVVIQVDSTDNTGTIKLPTTTATIPNNMNARQKEMMRLLSQSYPGKFVGVEDGEDLLRVLRKIGLPVELDQSARDDSLSEDDLVGIQLQNIPLIDLLDNTLEEYNAVLAITGNRIRIVSRDVIDNPEFFMQVTYDVSRLQFGDEYTADSTIKSLIVPDNWDDTNGDGALIFRKIGGREYLSIAQPLSVQLQLQRYLDGLLAIQGDQTMIAGNQLGAAYRESTVVGYPGASPGRRRRSNGFNGGGFGGGGIGGYGLGGGVF